MAEENADAFPQSQHIFLRIPQRVVAEYIPRMAQTLPSDFQMRLRQRMAALRLSANAASTKADLSRETVRKLLEHGAGLPRGGTLQKLAAALETTEAFLLTGVEADQPGQNDEVRKELSYSDDDVEIKGVAAGSYQGAFQISDNTIGYTQRPRQLRGLRDVYALIIINDSMVPEHNPGEIKFATPSTRPRLGDSVVVEFERDPDLGPEAMIGRLKQNGQKIRIEKLNPPGEVEIEAAQLHRLHRIAPYREISP